MSAAQADVERLAEQAGVTINGTAPTDPQIKDESVYRTFLSGNNISIGEAFMAGLWDVEDLAGLYAKLLDSRAYEQIGLFRNPGIVLRALFFNLQSRTRSFQVAQEHYDLGSDLYQAMLDKRMVYTSARYDRPDMTLEQAQEAKLDWFCKQLDLQPGQRILDIGCGWGSFMKYAVEQYDVTCVGLTVSEGQTKLGRELCAGLPIEFIVKDYRDFHDPDGFDHIVSIEMIEAVGAKNLRTYFQKAHDLLRVGGKFGLQAIGGNAKHPVADPWIDKYIFPNGILPSLHQLEEATRDLFIFDRLENIGPDYDPTLLAWWQRFHAAYPALRAANPTYDEQFCRMWKYYLQGCAGLFRTRQAQDWQIIFSIAP